MAIHVVNYRSASASYVDSLPTAGAGLHQKVLGAVRILLDSGKEAHEVLDILLPELVSRGRPARTARREIEKAVAKALSTATRGQSEPAWPKPDLDLINSIVRDELSKLDGCPIDYLRKLSPVTGATARGIIDALFPGDPLLCVGSSASRFVTRRKSDYLEFSNKQFIVPSPMVAIKGTTQDGASSFKTNDNTGPRRFLVLEFDFSEFGRDKETPTVFAPLIRSWDADGITAKQAQAAIALWLRRKREPVLVVDSGGKSFHVWFYVEGTPEDVIRATMRQAVTFGADRVTFTLSQFVRMPEGKRDNGTRQEAIYFSPNYMEKKS